MAKCKALTGSAVKGLRGDNHARLVLGIGIHLTIKLDNHLKILVTRELITIMKLHLT